MSNDPRNVDPLSDDFIAFLTARLAITEGAALSYLGDWLLAFTASARRESPELTGDLASYAGSAPAAVGVAARHSRQLEAHLDSPGHDDGDRSEEVARGSPPPDRDAMGSREELEQYGRMLASAVASR